MVLESHFLSQVPNNTKSNIRYTCIGYDIFPTVADLAQLNKSGIKFQMPENLDGVSLVNLLKKDTSIGFGDQMMDYIFHFPHYNICGLNEPHSAIRIGNHKLVSFTSERILLFDLSVDVAKKRHFSNTKNLYLYIWNLNWKII